VVIRLLGLLGGLSGVLDLGTGAALDESVKRCVVGARLASAVGGSPDLVRDVMYTSLLQHLGCTAPSHELAREFGDDISAIRMSFLADTTRPSEVLRTFIPGVAAASGRGRLATVATVAAMARTARDTSHPIATCEVAATAADRLGLGGPVVECLAQVTTMWDGSGYPRRSGSGIPLALRMTQVAGIAALLTCHAGPEVALDGLRRRAGTWLDPDLVAAFTPDLLDGILDEDALDLALDLEPDPVRFVDHSALLDAAVTFGDLVDLKSPWLHGHSGAVADLAGRAAERLGLPEADRVRLAGHLHDVGRAGISARIWSKPGALTTTERDQARLHPHFTELVLKRTVGLADVARLAGQHHERCDGSGYHRGLRAADLSLASRVLAAADRYCCDVEGRPHRPSLPPAEAASRLRAAARAGSLDPQAVEAVLACAAPAREERSSTGVAGLTSRQLEVLRLVTSGLSNRQIGARLGISPRTAEHHVQDVYQRIGVSSRATAALYAMEHGLIHPPA
jgi:HD-GYP domain-containing protein (c-di-GMP phosphodiesterase class II)